VVLLLDTHVWIWTVEGAARRIGRRTQRLLGKAEPDEAIRISPVTLFELAALHTHGRIRFTRSLEQWISEALGASGVHLAELSAGMAIDAGHIPRDALPDPLDRLLVATARHLDARFLTSDARILDYAARAGGLPVHDARL
jgi:PIN domain nuclease of toxin-antitoxin system